MINGYEINSAEINGTGSGAGSQASATLLLVAPDIVASLVEIEVRAEAELTMATFTITATMRLDSEEPVTEIVASVEAQVAGPFVTGFLRPASLTGAQLKGATPTVWARSGAQLRAMLPGAAIASHAVSDLWGKAQLQLALPALQASGSMESRARVALTLVTPVAAVLGGAQVSSALPRPAVSASAMSDLLARGDILLSAPGVEALAYQDAIARADLAIEAPTSLYGVTRIEVSLPAVQAAAVLDELVEHIAYAMNLRSHAMTPYDNYSFGFVVRFQGRHYGFSEEGAYLLEGDDDDGIKINAQISLPPTDFGLSQEKRAAYVYVGSADRRQLLVTAEIDDCKTVSAATTMAGRNKRAKLPRGARGRFWAHTIRNVQGGPMAIDSIEILPEVGRRKV